MRIVLTRFLSDFHKNLVSLTPRELSRELSKQYPSLNISIRHVLQNLSKELHEISDPQKALSKFQETFHTKVEQIASNYSIWKVTGCKNYAKPKVFISNKISLIAKKAFDKTLNDHIKETVKHP